MKSRRLDIFWHLFLYLGFVVGAIAVYFSRYSASRQYIVLMLLVVFYLLWGWVYHQTKGDATRKIFLEYLFIALIAMMAGFLVLMS